MANALTHSRIFLDILGWLISQWHIVYSCKVISDKGILVDLSKIEAIMDWETPRNAWEVENFMGLATYYKIFVEGFS